jgi:hypothetical protein
MGTVYERAGGQVEVERHGVANAREGGGPAHLERGQALEQQGPRGMTSEGRGGRHDDSSAGGVERAPGVAIAAEP